MFTRLKNSRLMFWSVEILVLVTIFWVCTKISFLFQPIATFLNVVFMPILISGFLYYMLNPLVSLLMRVHFKKFRINRTGAVALVFLLMVGVIAYGISYLLPRLVTQISQLIANLPDLTKETQKTFSQLMDSPMLKHIDVTSYLNKFNDQISSYAQSFMSSFTSSLVTIIGTITSVTVVAITVPVMLFYMLKDGHKLIPAITRFLPKQHRSEIIGLLAKMADTISHYIGGQVIECLFVGTFTAIGYIIIGQPYGLLLGVIAGLANIIPYIGPYIGIAPSLVVAITKSPIQVVYVIIVVIIVQQIDGNLVYPNIIGRSLQIHPLTIIILLLAAGNIAGILGMILAIPAYAVVKTIVEYVYSIYRLRSQADLANATTVYKPQPAKATLPEIEKNKKS